MRFLHNSYHKPKKSKGILVFYFLLSILLTCFVLFQGCRSIQYVPIKETVIEKDTFIKLDSIIIELPYEVKNNNIPYNQKSVLETSLAKSTAYLDSTDNQLKHSLENKPQAKLDPDTVFKFKIKEVYKEIPVEVIKEVPYIPNWAWITMCLGVILAILKIKSIFK